MLPLELSISPGIWNIFSGRKNDPAFFPLRDRVFDRDHYTCQYCGFQAAEHQEVVNIDKDYRNNRIDNLATACVLCTQCHFLSAAGVAYGGGKLIYMPELTQVQLNSFCHVVFCAMMNKTGYMTSAQGAYRHLRLRAQAIEKKFGTGSSTPSTFCRLVLNQKAQQEESLRELFLNIRLLPSYTKFKPQLADWAQAAAEELAQEQADE